MKWWIKKIQYSSIRSYWFVRSRRLLLIPHISNENSVKLTKYIEGNNINSRHACDMINQICFPYRSLCRYRDLASFNNKLFLKWTMLHRMDFYFVFYTLLALRCILWTDPNSAKMSCEEQTIEFLIYSFKS